VANGVNAFFHGHDRQYAYVKRDGIVYQSLPSGGFSGSGFNIYSTGSGYTIQALPGPGHLRVTVTPSRTTVDYIGTSDGAINCTYRIGDSASNVPPIAYDQNVSAPQETALPTELTAADADYDPLTYNVETAPAHGSLNGSGASPTYTPGTSYTGPNSFTFKANDVPADSNIATVSISVTPNGTLGDVNRDTSVTSTSR
jgi:hypothetical protein